MVDFSLLWNEDISVSSTGDIGTVDGTLLGQQRILRRLLTNQKDYIWQPNYGAGLAAFVGSPVDVGQIRAIVRSQIFLESCVARTPEPSIDVQLLGNGTILLHIQYVDAVSSTTQSLSFSVKQ